MIFIFVFSTVSGIEGIYADPPDPKVTYMKYVREKNIGEENPTNILYIYGLNFENPVVLAGSMGWERVEVSSYDSNTIVIKDTATNKVLSGMVGKNNRIRVYNEGGTLPDEDKWLDLDLSSIPTANSLSKNKAYTGTSLTITGDQFGGLDPASDVILVSGTEYKISDSPDADPYNADISADESTMTIDSVKSANQSGLSNVKIVKKVMADDDVTLKYEIESVLNNSITVVGQITNIGIDRIDPNAGPREKKNQISIFGLPGASAFQANMRLFVVSAEGVAGKFYEAVNKGVITDGSSNVIGIRFELPIMPQKLPDGRAVSRVDLVLTTWDKGSELVLPDAFTFLDIGNTLTLDDRIVPNFKKETEYKPVQLEGRNIGYLDQNAYDKLSDVNVSAAEYIGYGTYLNFTDPEYFKIKYTGIYDKNGSNQPVTIIRQFAVQIDSSSKVPDTVAGSVYYNFTLDKDTITVVPPNVTLNPKQPKQVDVSVKTLTTVFRETGGGAYTILYSRVEEDSVPQGFTFLPNEITPTITSVTPEYGPGDKDIYVTIYGNDFQVSEDGKTPTVTIGGRPLTDKDGSSVLKVYDDQNRIVDGKIITMGTKIKGILPAGSPTDGAADVVVINPSKGQDTLENGFEYRDPVIRNPNAYKEVKINQVDKDYADIRGGKVSGERNRITGENFFTSAADQNHRLTITVDGEKADVDGRVSSDGKTVTIIAPPGTVPGWTKLQLINEDGTMAEKDFEYRLVTSSPKIIKIAPVKGGKGTKLIIKGEDFVMPDNTAGPDESRRKGSVVILDGRELNAYDYNDAGKITEIGGDIYYDIYPADPELDGHMVKVQDSNTIYVDIPDSFYSFDSTAASAPYLKSELIPLGELKVEVQNPDGAKSKENVKFTYMNPATHPSIISIDPNSGSVEGGTVVTIIGSDFRKDDLEVYFGPEKSTKVNFIGPTMLTALVPEYPYPLPGGADHLTVPVMVLNYDGGAAVDNNGFTYRVPGSHPVISSVTPNQGSTAGNDDIALLGLDFRRDPNDNTAAGLPKVYFNGKQAEVTWPAGESTNSTGKLIVKTPGSNTTGAAEIVLVNYDSGSCTYKGFTYVKSQPKIDTVTPEQISTEGNIKVQINGSGFREGELDRLFTLPGGNTEAVSRGTDTYVSAGSAINSIVAFGDESTGDKRMIDTILGPFSTELGDLKIDCDISSEDSVGITISNADDESGNPIARRVRQADGSIISEAAELDIPIGSSHMFIINHNKGNGVTYDEGVLVEVTPSEVFVTRRIAPYAKVEYDGVQVTVLSPPVERVGWRNLYVINDDGGLASKSISILSPDSNPVITSINPKNKARTTTGVVDYVPENEDTYLETYTYVPLEGGAFVTINGSDFRRNVKVYLDNKPLEIVSKSVNDDQLVIKIPSGAQADLGRLYRIVIVNNDGGMADSSKMEKPHYIVYQSQDSFPVIETIVPDKTSNRGQNKIIITGENFKAGVKVFIEGVECVTVRDEDKPSYVLHVDVPSGLGPGKKTVQVLNTDYGFFEKKDGLTIISSPYIDEVYKDDGKLLNPLVFSIEGGEKIRLSGIDFMEGAKVIIGGILKPKTELQPGETGLEGFDIQNREMVVIGGVQALDVTVTGNDVINFTTPKLNIGGTSIIVINTDGGVSNLLEGDYEKPMPDAPKGFRIEVVDGDTIRAEWDKVKDVSYYEIYVSISLDGKKNKTYDYLGSVVPEEISDKRLRYYVDGLLSDTWYSMKLRSVNIYGTSTLSSATPYRKTSKDVIVTHYQGTDEFISGIIQNDKIRRDNLELFYSVGENSIKGSSGLSVNLGQPAYSTANPKTVEIGLGLLEKYPTSDIKITDKDMVLRMTAADLFTDDAESVDKSLYSDAVVRLTINRSLGARGDEIRIMLPKGYRLITNPFSVELSLQVKNDTTRLKGFKGDINIAVKYQQSMQSAYPGGIYLAYYDKASKKLQILDTLSLNGNSEARISASGAYVLIGKYAN